jgi:hypothetical protein
MQPDTRPRTVRASITIDIYDQGLLNVLIWARQSAHQLTSQLWEHGVLAHTVSVAIDERPCTP